MNDPREVPAAAKYKDLRDWLRLAEADGELKRIDGANCDLEMAGIAEILYREGRRPVPALLFDNVPGYAKGFRTLFGVISSPRRLARALNLSGCEERLDVVRALREKSKTFKPIPPKVVERAAFFENTLKGDAIDLYKFPVPRHHEADGGRYIGTGGSFILKDPESGFINVGTYRAQLIDRDRIALHATEGQHGTIIREKYFHEKKVMPVVFAAGFDPALFVAACDRSVGWGQSEFDHAGGLKGEPIDIVNGPLTGLPIPADAEFVIEGECHPGDVVDEGPFGEWMGYYANLGENPVPEPVIRVKAVYHRNDPILNCAHPSVPPSEMTAWTCITRSAMFWNGLEKMGITGVKGVWCHEQGGSLLFTVISIKQMHAGHAKRVGLAADAIAHLKTRYTIVVDEDIDPANLSQVIWAIATRADPERAIQILQHCGTSSADTTVPPSEKKKWLTAPKPLYSGRAIIDACQPFEWKHEWYPVAKISDKLQADIEKKWASLLKELR